MSRVANNPVSLPKGVEVNINGSSVSVKGGKGTMEMTLTDGIGIDVNEGVAQITYDFDTNRAMAGCLITRCRASAGGEHFVDEWRCSFVFQTRYNMIPFVFYPPATRGPWRS